MSARRPRPNLHSLPAGLPFLETLADAVLSDRLDLGMGRDDPAALASATIYLPTRRAARALSTVLVRMSGRSALILPRLVPLGDPAEAEAHDMLTESGAEPELLRAAWPIDPLARQVLLARQIMAASRARDARLAAEDAAGGSLAASTLGSAFALAEDLSAILDAMQAEDVSFDRIRTLDATRFDELWQMTARFLAILSEAWPKNLADRGETDLVLWRNRLIDRQAERLARGDAPGPVIVAGSTGSISATGRLIGAVARMPRGAVVLPDLDLHSPDATWTALTRARPEAPDRSASHPQALLARLLERMGAAREDVRELGGMDPRAPRALRRRLVHEALRPAGTTHEWARLAEVLPAADMAAAFQGLRVVEAPDERGEALALALAIKQELMRPESLVALVTPDRGLAERVALELGRWGIEVDDSAGQALGRTTAGFALILLLEAMLDGAGPETLIDLAHHPRLTAGLGAARMAQGRQALEIGVLRGARAYRGLDELAQAVRALPERIADWRAPGPRRRLGPDDQAAAHEVASGLASALAPLLALAGGEEGFALAPAIAQLRQALLELSRDEEGESAIFSGEDGQELGRMLDELEAASDGALGRADDLARICRTVLGQRVVRARRKDHPRVMLLGLLEARLVSADLMILGGLNEGAWPPSTRTDPFLNRVMRAELGLSSPERRIGQAAHDFIQAFCAPRALISRAVKTGGVQALPSRFWQRLRTVVDPAVWAGALAEGAGLVRIAAAIDRPDFVSPARRPAPKPPAALQPRRFSVTEVEVLYRDPYEIFARRILGLQALEPMQVALGAADRGSLLHEVVEAFARRWPAALPPDPHAELVAIGRQVFARLAGEPDVAAFWWPRFLEMAPAIARWEQGRRLGVGSVGAELRIEQAFPLPFGGEVLLSARADRVEQRLDGRLAILDFKTGTPPSTKQVKAGLAPQLLLEAAMAPLAAFRPVGMAEGAGARFGPAPVAEVAYVALRPGQDGVAETKGFELDSLAETAAEHLAAFQSVVGEFHSGARAYVSRFAPQFMRYETDYDHLARVKEWSAGPDAGSDEA